MRYIQISLSSNDFWLNQAVLMDIIEALCIEKGYALLKVQSDGDKILIHLGIEDEDDDKES